MNTNLSDSSNSESEGSILYPNNNLLNENIDTLSKDDVVNNLCKLIEEKDRIIKNFTLINTNFSNTIINLNSVIDSLNKNTIIKNSFSYEKYIKNALLLEEQIDENLDLKTEVSNFKRDINYLNNKLNLSHKAYNSLNTVFTIKVRENMENKINHINKILDLKKMHHTMVLNLSERIDALEYKLKDKKNEICMSCKICYNEPIDITIAPCNHLVMCKNCMDELSKIDTAELKCPLCQENITDFTKIYLPE